MALARCYAVGLVGIDGHVVEVEAHIANGLPGFTLVGLPDTALQEARDRVRAAVLNSGLPWPQRRITLGLSPAWLPKRGSGFDLAMAVAILAATDVLPRSAADRRVFVGELGLDGSVRPVRGVLPAVLAATAAGHADVVVPVGNAVEAALVPGARAVAVDSLGRLVTVLRGEADPLPPPARPRPPAVERGPDLADVVGQPTARRAVEVAAAGGHHLFLQGPPGVGKTMLAERLPGLMPDLEAPEALEVTAVHSVAGLLPADSALVARPPFASPHHTASVPALVGGGSGLARPGAASVAHRGVLFLDEAPEFRTGALDALRQPLESGVVAIARSGGTVRYPARFTLVLAANPCPCGVGGLTAPACTCTPLVRRRYLGRLSGPLLDRVDLQVRLEPVSRADLLADVHLAEPSEVVAKRVREARDGARARLGGSPWRANAEVPGRVLTRRWPLPAGDLAPLHVAMDRGLLSARGAVSTLRVAWTLADLAGRERPDAGDLDEALALRSWQPR